jgi:hypothetical protein
MDSNQESKEPQSEKQNAWKQRKKIGERAGSKEHMKEGRRKKGEEGTKEEGKEGQTKVGKERMNEGGERKERWNEGTKEGRNELADITLVSTNCGPQGGVADLPARGTLQAGRKRKVGEGLRRTEGNRRKETSKGW